MKRKNKRLLLDIFLSILGFVTPFFVKIKTMVDISIYDIYYDNNPLKRRLCF